MLKRLFLALALLFGVVLTANTANAQARWQNFGADRAYASRDAAMADAANVFRRAGWPPEAVTAMTERMRTPGERIRIVNGDRFDFMRTGPSGLWRNVLVDFRRPVQNMEYAAPAERWTVTVGGMVYEAILPDVCNNLAGRVKRVPPPPAGERCVEVTFRVPPGARVRWGIGSNEGPLPPSECNAQREGGGAWQAWYGECDECVPAYGYIRQELGGAATVPHRYYYRTTAREQTIRFSTSVWSRVFYICLEYEVNGRTVDTCGVYIAPGTAAGDWNQRYVVDIPDSLWLINTGRCPR